MAKEKDQRKRVPHPEKKNGAEHDAHKAHKRESNKAKNADNLERLKATALEWRG